MAHLCAVSGPDGSIESKPMSQAACRTSGQLIKAAPSSAHSRAEWHLHGLQDTYSIWTQFPFSAEVMRFAGM